MEDTRVTALLWVALAVLAAVWLSVTIGPTYSLFRLIPNGYNEGWNAYWAEVAWSGGSLYPALDSPVSNNYPPVSFYIVGGLGSLLGDNIIAGRLVALVSLIVIAFDLFVWLRVCEVHRAVAAFGAVLFLAAFAQYAPAYIAMNDPQLLAHAIVVTSAMLLWRFDFGRNALLAAAVLMVVGGMVKHLLIALPVAMTLWIAIYRRQQLATWLIAAVSAALAAIALIYLTQGAVFFDDLASSRLYSRQLVEAGAGRVWHSWGFLLVLSVTAVLAWLSRFSSRAMREQAGFALLYLALAGVIGALAAGGKGVDRNAFFDLLMAACLAVAIGVEHLRTRTWDPGARRVAAPGAGVVGAPGAGIAAARGAGVIGPPDAGVVGTLGWGARAWAPTSWVALSPVLVSVIALGCSSVFAIRAVNQWPARWALIQQTDAREAAAVEMVDAIRALGGGEAACEELSLCYWAGSAFKVDFFNYGQKLATAALPAGDCAETFSPQSVALIQVNSPPGDPRLSWRLPQPCNDAIARVYSPVASTSSARLMRPVKE
jgi:hypothetical protein